MMYIIISVICVILAVRIYFARKYERLMRLGEKFPGPRCWPLVQNALELGNSTTDLPVAALRLFSTYGVTFRLWIANELFVLLAKPEDVEVILGSNKTIDKARDYNFLKPWIGTGLLTSTGAKWRKHRKILTPTFHFKILEEFVDVFNVNGDILVESLQREVNGPTFDVYNYVTLYALDNICETAMGIKMNAQRNRDSDYVKAVRAMGEVLMQRMYKPWLRPEALFHWFPQGRLHDKSIKVLHEVSNNVVQTRKREILAKRERPDVDVRSDDSGVKKRLAFLDLLLEASLEGNDLSDQDIREEVDTFMFEGHDTTSSAVSFTLYVISQHPDIQDKVVAEMDALFADVATPATFRDLQEMKYLERVLKEVLRLYPSVPLIARDVKEDIPLVDGTVVPQGSTVLILPAATHRVPEIFPDPEVIDPDRFLPENCQGRHPYAYFPFSAGPRNCIGQKFAMMELKAAVSHVIRHYKLLPAPPEEGIKMSAELIMKSGTGLRLKIVPRK